MTFYTLETSSFPCDFRIYGHFVFDYTYLLILYMGMPFYGFNVSRSTLLFSGILCCTVALQTISSFAVMKVNCCECENNTLPEAFCQLPLSQNHNYTICINTRKCSVSH